MDGESGSVALYAACLGVMGACISGAAPACNNPASPLCLNFAQPAASVRQRHNHASISISPDSLYDLEVWAERCSLNHYAIDAYIFASERILAGHPCNYVKVRVLSARFLLRLCPLT